MFSGVFKNNIDTSCSPAGSHHALSSRGQLTSPMRLWAGAKRRCSLMLPKMFSQAWGKGAIFEPLCGPLSLQGGKACSHPSNIPCSAWIHVLSLSQVRTYLGLEGMTPYFSVCRMSLASKFEGPQNKGFILICGKLISTLHILFFSFKIFLWGGGQGFLP